MTQQGKAAEKGPDKDGRPKKDGKPDKPKNGKSKGGKGNGRKPNGGKTGSKLSADLRKRIEAMIEALVHGDREAANETFEHMLTRAGDLFQRKQAMEGTKSETRDLIGEVMFTRLRRAFRDFLGTNDAADEIKCAEWAMGLLYSGSALHEFAAALDRAILETSRPMD